MSFQKDPQRKLLPQNNSDLVSAPLQGGFYYAPRMGYEPAPATESDSLNFLIQGWRTILRNKGTLLLFALGGALLASVITLQLTPIYQARTTIEIQGMNDNFLGLKSAYPTLDLPDYSADGVVQTQVQLLHSQSLLKRVLPKLTTPALPAVESPEPYSAWRNLLGLPQPKAQTAWKAALQYAAGHLQVKSPENTRVVELTCDSPDPRAASAFLNTLTTEFIDQNLESRWNTSQHTGEWLTKQLEALKVKLERSEDELQAYAQSTGLMFTGEKESVSEDRLRQLQQELLKVEVDRALKQSRYEQSMSAKPESMPEVLDSSSLKEYRAKLADLRRQYAELSSTLTPAHYKVQKVEAQIAEVQKEADRERTNVLHRITSEYESAQRRERLIRNDYQAQARLVTNQSAKVIHYSILKREVDTNRQLYDSMLQKVKEAGITAAMRASNLRVVDVAEPPSLPYKPNPLRNGFTGLMAGLCVGILFVVMRERIDRSIQSPGDAPAFLNMPEFGVIPSAQVDTRRRFYGPSQVSGGALETAQNGNGRPPEMLELTMLNRSPSLLAESFRSTLTSILFSSQNGAAGPRLIVMTSASPSEGKTTVVSNLGLAMVETHRRVLLIDADLRRPRLHDIFNVPNDFGLRDVLDSLEPIEEVAPRAILETATPGLHVMPSGSMAPSISTVLHSAQLPPLFAYLQTHFDAVLIDTPPMLQMPDARILARAADGVILVLRAGKTTRDTAQIASQRLMEDGTPVLGTILNDWNPTHKASYGYYNYNSDYHQYHGRTNKSS